MCKEYVDVLVDLEKYYQDAVLPEFGITQQASWERHVKTNPDNFLHIFTVSDVKYALAFDDYPSGFSVGQDPSVKSLRLTDGNEVLHIGAKDKYIENRTGSFMLFQVVDPDGFEQSVDYVEASYSKLQRQWRNEQRDIVAIARDVLQLAETASRNHDGSMLYSLQNIVEAFIRLDVDDKAIPIDLLEEYVKILLDAEFAYEFYTPEDKKRVGDEIYKLLSKEVQDTIKIQKYETSTLGQTVRLVSAMYAKVEGNTTKGMSVTIIFEGEKMTYPTDHFANSELRKYFSENSHVNRNNIEHHMPKLLHGYRLVEGSVCVQDVFPRELEYISY